MVTYGKRYFDQLCLNDFWQGVNYIMYIRNVKCVYFKISNVLKDNYIVIMYEYILWLDIL